MRYIATLLALALLVTSRLAIAQPPPVSVVEDDLGGFPIRNLYLPLQGGVTYEIRTDYTMSAMGPAAADATLSLLPSGTLGAVAGASDCASAPGGWDPAPACFTYEPPGKALQDFVLILHATQTETPGKTRIWIRPEGGSWTLAESTIVFGGGVMETGKTTGRLVLRTAHLPGAARWHVILSSKWGWEMFDGRFYNGPVGSAATVDIPEVSGTNYAGITYHVFGSLLIANAGASRLIFNQWYESGYDQDGDGLDFLVEDRLGTCDSGDQITGTGFDCKSLYGCEEDAYGEVCLRSSRDTDHDGLRDDLETFGYWKSSGSDPYPELELPRMGANPAHYDVFIELDARDQDDDDENGCQGFTDVNLIGVDNLGNFGHLPNWAQQVFDQAPVTTSTGVTINPDGLPGMNLHWDVGLDNPDPEDTRWGNWGGGNTCVSLDCRYGGAWEGSSDCGGVPTQDPHRRFVFRFALDHTEYAGQTAGNSMFYGAGTTENHVHEIGHVGWLTHAGPRFGAANNQAGANFRPTYLSRINYRFGIPSASNWATYWTSLTFSDGDWLFPVSSADGLPEISPIGGADLGVLAVGNPSENVRTNPAGDDMDWDRSGNFNAGGARPFIGQISLTPAGRLSRMHSPRTAQRAVRGVDMAIVNDVLISADTQDIGYARLAGDSDENCERYPILDWRTLEMSSGYEPCFDWDHGELLLEDDGTPIHAESISVARAVLDGTQRLLVVTTSAVDGSTWTEVAVESTPTSLDMSIKSTGTFAPGITLSLDPDDEPELVTLPSGGVVAIFRNAATGALLQSYHAPSLTAAWATPTAFLVDGTPPTYDVVPAATSTDGETYAVGSSGATSTVLRLTSATGGQWVTVESVPASGTPGRDPRGRLELVAAPQVFDPGVTELYMFGRGTVDDDQDLVTFRYTDVSALGTSSWSASQVYWNSKWPPTGAFRVAAIWDDRASVSPETRDLRLLHYTDATCTNDDVCESAFGDGVSCIDKLCEDGTDALLGALRFHPFARGSDPTFYTDYDDWAMMWWGFCEHSQQAETQGWVPSTTDTYRPLPYTGDRRCGPAPWFPEPTPSGMYFLVPAPDDSERTTNPDLYAPSEFVCEL